MSKYLPLNLFIRQALAYPLTSPFLPPVDKVEKDHSYAAGKLVGTLAAGLLKTGQTIQYDEKKDDGYYEKGIAHSYTILTTDQYSLTTNIVINGKTHALSNNCVIDNITGLMWARYVPLADIGPAANGRLFWKQYTLAAETVTFTNADGKITADAGAPFDRFALGVGRKFTVTGSGAGNDGTYTVTAITTSVITVSEPVNDEAGISIAFASIADLIWDFVDQANANSLGGHADWRIPNYHELISIVDLGVGSPTIDITTFPSTPTSGHWTASTHPIDSSKAFMIFFSLGRAIGYYKVSEKYYVRLVRG